MGWYVVTSNDMPATPARKPAVTAALQRDAEGLHLALAELVRVYQFRDRDNICCHDISVTQCYALETIVDHGPLRLGGLAERLFLDKSTTSRVVATLVKKRYVQQRPDARTPGPSPSARPRGASGCARASTPIWSTSSGSCWRIWNRRCRTGVVEVVRRLARAAHARFRSGVSVGAAPACCASDGGAPACA